MRGIIKHAKYESPRKRKKKRVLKKKILDSFGKEQPFEEPKVATRRKPRGL